MILGHKYQVQVTQIPDEDSTTVCGISDHIEYTIKINECLSQEMRLNTLIHEICHQILAISGLTKLLRDNMEESICESLGTGLCNVLTSNFVELIKE